MAHTQKTPPEWQAAVTSGAVKDPGPRLHNDPDWVRRDREFKASKPRPDYSAGSGEGHNNG